MKTQRLFPELPWLSDEKIKMAMDELRMLREEVAIAEVEAELQRARPNVRALRQKGNVHPATRAAGAREGKETR